MKYLFASAALCALLAGPVMAQTQPAEPAEEKMEPATAEEVDAAVKTLNALAADEKNVAGYCAISKEMGDVKEGDEAKAEEVGTKMDSYLTGLGEDYIQAFETAEAVAPDSDDAKKLDAAYEALEEKCES